MFLYSFLCPAIENPDQFGVIEGKHAPEEINWYSHHDVGNVPGKTKRTLSIIAEVFQRLAKNNYFLFYKSLSSTASSGAEALNQFIRDSVQPICQEVQNWASKRPKSAYQLLEINRTNSLLRERHVEVRRERETRLRFNFKSLVAVL